MQYDDRVYPRGATVEFITRVFVGSKGASQKEWIVAVTEQPDETGRRRRRGRPKNRRNYR